MVTTVQSLVGRGPQYHYAPLAFVRTAAWTEVLFTRVFNHRKAPVFPLLFEGHRDQNMLEQCVDVDARWSLFHGGYIRSGDRGSYQYTSNGAPAAVKEMSWRMPPQTVSAHLLFLA
jgi:hypothetical protein